MMLQNSLHIPLFRGYKIYVDDRLVAVAEETQQGFQSITFRGAQEARWGERGGRWMEDVGEMVGEMVGK